MADRINLVSDYDGFDPTGICSIFASAGAASKILGLDKKQTWNALSIAHNKSGGSFQRNCLQDFEYYHGTGILSKKKQDALLAAGMKPIERSSS